MSSMKKDLKKKLEQCQTTIVKTRGQKKTAEAEAKAAEAELRASTNASENAELKKKVASLNKEVTDIWLRGDGEGTGDTPERFDVNDTRRSGTDGRRHAQQASRLAEQATK